MKDGTIDSSMKKLFSIFSDSTFLLLWVGTLFSQIGSQMQVVGVSWQMYTLTHSAVQLGFIGLVGFLPVIAFSPIGGLIVDKFNRKKLLIINQILYAIITLAFGAITAWGYANPFLIYLMLFLMGLLTVIDLPARQSIVASILPKEKLINGFNMITIARQISVLAGPAVAGFLIAGHGVKIIYIINGISFFLFLLTIIYMDIPRHVGEKSVRLDLASVKEGISYIFHSPILYSTMILDFFATFFAAATVIFPIFAIEILHIGVKGIGFLYAAPAIGAVITGLFLGTLHIKRQGRAILWAVVIYSIATIGFGLSHWFWLSLIFLAISGAADMVSMVIRRTISQVITPNELRGRMNAINMIFFMGGPYLGETEAGFAAALFGAPVSVILGGIGALLATIGIARFVPLLRNHTES